MNTAKLRAVINALDTDKRAHSSIQMMIYLADWKNALSNACQITDIEWISGIRSPSTDADRQPLMNFIATDRAAEPSSIIDSVIGFFTRKPVSKPIAPLNDQELASIHHVNNVVKDLSFSDLVTLVYSTRPILTSNRYTNKYIDLIAHATEQNKEAQA